jgi:branched-subunit amino acid ABC-type transport system permease component
MENLIASLLNGVIYGLLLFMVSAGLTLIFGMMGVLNFAHASFYMLGAYFAYALQDSLGFWGALAASPILVGLVGVVVEKYFLRRVHHHGHAHELLLTFGLSFIIAELIKLFFGNFPVDYRIPASMDFALFRLGATNYPAYRILMGSVAVVMFLLVYLLLTRTRVGIVVRSAIYKPRMAEALGHNVPLVFMGVFGVGAALAGLAGASGRRFLHHQPEHGAGAGRHGVRGRCRGRPGFYGRGHGGLAADRRHHLAVGGSGLQPGRHPGLVRRARLGRAGGRAAHAQAVEHLRHDSLRADAADSHDAPLGPHGREELNPCQECQPCNRNFGFPWPSA